MYPLLTLTLLTLFLLPCAIQDWRRHQVSNWLTVPAFCVAWVAAVALDHLPLTMAVFAGCYVAWSMHLMGAADGKLATLVAAIAPIALGIGVLLLGLTFLLLRLFRKQSIRLPAAAWFWLASMLYAIWVSGQVQREGFTLLWQLVLFLPELSAMCTGLFAMTYLYIKLGRSSIRSAV